MKIHNYFSNGSKNPQNKEGKTRLEYAGEEPADLNENSGPNGQEPEDLQERPDIGDTVFLPPQTEVDLRIDKELNPESEAGLDSEFPAVVEPDSEMDEEKVYIRSGDSISAEKDLGKGPIGLDVGTTSIVLAHKNNKDFHTRLELNAFYTIPSSKITKDAFSSKGLMFFERNDLLYILSRSMRG